MAFEDRSQIGRPLCSRPKHNYLLLKIKDLRKENHWLLTELKKAEAETRKLRAKYAKD